MWNSSTALRLRDLIKAAFLGVFWTIASLFFGMAPVFVRFLLSVFSTKRQMMSIEDMLRDGLLIGLLLALLGAVCIDWIFLPSHKIETFSQKLFFIVFPLLAIFFLGVSFAALFMANDAGELNVSQAKLFCSWMSLVCVVYCVIAKFFFFLPPQRTVSHE